MLFTKVKPMLLTKHEEGPFDSDQHLFELKLDGARVLLHCDFESGRVELYTKARRICTSQFPEFQDLRLSGVRNIILDGEIVAMTNGKPDFTKVLQRLAAGREKALTLCETSPVSIVAFDIIFLNNRNLKNQLLMDRKRLLAEVVEDSNLLSKGYFVPNDGKLLYDYAKANNLEGVVAKSAGSQYQEGRRTKSWQKIKAYTYSEMELIGYEFGTGTLLVGKGGVPVAKALGVRPTDREAIVRLLPQISKKKDKNMVYIERGIRCLVKYTTGPSGNIRECVFDRWVV